MSELTKQWPNDAIMVVAANEGTEIVENMEGRVACVCRDCGQELMADTRTVRLAAEHYTALRRPIRFFCVACHAKYDLHSIDVMEDHRA